MYIRDSILSPVFRREDIQIIVGEENNQKDWYFQIFAVIVMNMVILFQFRQWSDNQIRDSTHHSII